MLRKFLLALAVAGGLAAGSLVSFGPSQAGVAVGTPAAPESNVEQARCWRDWYGYVHCRHHRWWRRYWW